MCDVQGTSAVTCAVTCGSGGHGSSCGRAQTPSETHSQRLWCCQEAAPLLLQLDNGGPHLRSSSARSQPGSSRLCSWKSCMRIRKRVAMVMRLLGVPLCLLFEGGERSRSDQGFPGPFFLHFANWPIQSCFNLKLTILPLASPDCCIMKLRFPTTAAAAAWHTTPPVLSVMPPAPAPRPIPPHDTISSTSSCCCCLTPTSVLAKKGSGPGKAKAPKKSDLPSKVCLACGRPFTWRKKWEKVWDEVKYCSDRCRGSRPAQQAGQQPEP